MNYDMLQKEILSKNPDEIFEQYYETISKLSFSDFTIPIGKRYYRARKGNDKLEAAIDDLNKVFDIPYFNKDIDAPPSKLASGGRFNREGTSYLYLASDIQTCISEVHLEVNQICSIAQFECIREANLLDLTKVEKGSELEKIYNILTQPVHSEMRNYYLITQFISDIIKKMGFWGIAFTSTQNEGVNIVCFKRDVFEYVRYSEKMYQAKKITYIFDEIQEEYKKYNDYRKLLSSYNEYENEKRESKYEYISSKIEDIDRENYEKRIIEINNVDDCEKECLLNNLIAEFNNTFFLQKAYQFRGAFFINKGEVKKGICDFIDSFKHLSMVALKDVKLVKEAIFKNMDIDENLKDISLEETIRSECLEHINEVDKKLRKSMKFMENMKRK